MRRLDIRSHKIILFKRSYAPRARLPLGWMILAIFLSGCSGILYSSLDRDDIRATAQDIATTRLATTVEVIILPTLTLGPDVPTATVNPTFCPQEDLDTWKEDLLIDIELLFSEVASVNSNSNSPEQINEIYIRARSQAGSLRHSPHPGCAEKVVLRVTNLYEQFRSLIEAVQAGDPTNIQMEREAFQKAKSRLTSELRDILSDKDFKVFNAIVWAGRG